MRLIYSLFLWYGFEAIITSKKYWIFPEAIYSIARIVDELFIILFLINIVLNFRTHSKYISKSVLIFSFAYLSLLFFSGVINYVSPFILTEYIIRYGKGLIIVIYSLMFLNIDRKYLFNFMKYLRGFFLLQFFINSIWVLGIKIIPNGNFNNPDWAIGTFGNPFYIALFTGIVLSGTFYEFLIRDGISKNRIMYLTYIILCVVQLVWTDTKHLFFIIPLILMFQLFILNLIRYRTKVILLSIIIFFSFNGIRTYLGNYLSSNYKTGIRLMITSPKALAYYNSFVVIPSEVPFGLLGAGPGKGGSFIGKEDNSHLTNKYFTKYNIDELREGTTIATVPYTGITTIQSELGFIGFTIFIIMIFVLSKNIWAKNRYNIISRYYNHLSQIDFIAFFCLLLFIIENILVDLLQSSFFPVLVWFIISISYLHNRYDNISPLKI